MLIDFDTTRPRFGISLIEDRRDSFANPTRGRFWNITLQGVPKIWGSDVGYIRLYGQFFYYYPILKELIWASGIRLGLATGTSEILLTDDRFLAGGANSVRGFRQNSLGPSITRPETQSASSLAAKPSLFGIKSYAFRSTSCSTGASIGMRATSSPPPPSFAG